MKKVTVILAISALLLAGCSTELKSDEGTDLKQTQTEKKSQTEDFSVGLEEGLRVEQLKPEMVNPSDPEFPHLVKISEPKLEGPAEQDSTNYYLYDENDNFNNASITVFGDGAYPSQKEVGDLQEMGTNKYLEGWLEYVSTSKKNSPELTVVAEGFLNFEDGVRGAYVSYEFGAPSVKMPEGMEIPEGQDEVSVEASVEITKTYFTDFILIKGEKVLLGSSTSTESGFPAYLQTLEF